MTRLYLTLIKECRRLLGPTSQLGNKCLFTRDSKLGTIVVGNRFLSQNVRDVFKLKYNHNKPTLLEGPPSGDVRIDGVAILLLAMPCAAFALGTWQIFRWRDKLEMIANLEAKVHAPAMPMPENLSELDSLEYRKVTLRGKFDYTNEAWIGPRTLNKEGLPKTGIVKKVRNTAGYHIITPFKVSGKNVTILVNRGWIPSFRTTRKYKPIPESDEVEIVAVVRRDEKRPAFVGKDSGQAGLYLFRNVPSLADFLDTDEIFLDLHSVQAVDLTQSLPIPAQTRVTLPNDHVSYIFTWYGLSLITAYLWRRRFIRKLDLM